jgi:hypothetical protein
MARSVPNRDRPVIDGREADHLVSRRSPYRRVPHLVWRMGIRARRYGRVGIHRGKEEPENLDFQLYFRSIRFRPTRRLVGRWEKGDGQVGAGRWKVV